MRMQVWVGMHGIDDVKREREREREKESVCGVGVGGYAWN